MNNSNRNINNLNNNSNKHSNNNSINQELNCNKQKYSESIGCQKLEAISSLLLTFIIYIYTLLNFMSYSNSPGSVVNFETDDGYGNKSDNQIRRQELLYIISGFSIVMLLLLCYNIYNIFQVFQK